MATVFMHTRWRRCLCKHDGDGDHADHTDDCCYVGDQFPSRLLSDIYHIHPLNLLTKSENNEPRYGRHGLK
ncbi:hypothetical protein DPMN_037125 [Dreissena polymorpha]|uniref:Uncharacterized protein n=1 Tax=Dreissena polymorpha TaxID=45954 RepID=A0A9D4RPI3_DREPO|nr:hypothetical protein DPMN_037125 [Dreissena polymorpha]